MKQRIISALAGVAVLVLVLLGNQYVFDIVVTLISSIAVYEVINALGLKKFKLMTFISLLVPLAYTAISYTAISYIPVIIAVTAVYMIYTLINHDDFKFDMAAKFTIVSLIIPMCFLHVILTRRLGFKNLDVLVILLGCWITDTCAYFSGYLFGKHKLAPTISPKKTVEGSIGGMIGVALILVLYAFVASEIMNIGFNLLSTVAVGLLSGIFSQCGDLCASIIKRENNIKDFGNIMPGHGGVMDRFDSLLFVAPLVYYILAEFPIFIK